jgi:hypothetical protein
MRFSIDCKMINYIFEALCGKKTLSLCVIIIYYIRHVLMLTYEFLQENCNLYFKSSLGVLV